MNWILEISVGMTMYLSVWLLLCAAGVTICNGFDPYDWPKPPVWTDKAKTARYLVHYADWGIVSALSPEYDHRPFGTVESYADGTMENSTGIPYFYLSSMSDTYENVMYCNNVTLSLSEAMGTYCLKNKLDPEEPTCARLTVLGTMVKVTDPTEMQFAKQALFTRHPVMASWPTSHGWTFFKMNLQGLHLIDFFGGASHVPLKDYFNEKP